MAENCYALLRGFLVGYKNLGAPRLLRGGHGAAANEMGMKQPGGNLANLSSFPIEDAILNKKLWIFFVLLVMSQFYLP